MAALVNATFGEDEESDTEFNPRIGRGSDDEGDANDDGDRVDAAGADDLPPPAGEREQKTPRDLINGTKSKSQSPFPVADDEAEEADEDEQQPDGDEDEEGEGEDLGDEDEEDEEDEEEDEDDDDVVGRPKKRRRRALNPYFEEEAEVDDDEDDVDENEDDIAETGFIQDTHPDDDLGPEADNDDRRHRELDRQRQIEASLDAEAAAARLKERYGRRTTTGLAKGSFVPQNLLMPSVDDPRIWGVRCKPGKERDVISNLMRKFMQRAQSGKRMGICSAFERGGGPMAGFIFVEARRKAEVDEALAGIPDVYPRGQVDLIPMKEMPDLLRVNKTKPLETGGYVRIKRGLYTGDLGMIEEVMDNGYDVLIRLVPRLTYGLDEDDSRPATQEKRKRPAKFGMQPNIVNRPPPKLFNDNEAKKKHARFLVATGGLSGRNWTYKGETYEDGFLIKQFRQNVLETENVNPKLEEITRLTKTAADGSENIDLEALAHSLRDANAESAYVPGDEVEVYQGEQRGLAGRVEGVNGGILRIKVSVGEIAGQIIETPARGVRKRFREGDHVKVTGASRYSGEVGMVVRIKDDKVTVVVDNTLQEITVFSRDLREAVEAGGSDIKTNTMDVQDLVQIDATTVGIVIRSDREAVRVLDQNASIVTKLPSQLQKLETKKNAVATDRNGAEIKPGDAIREAAGENKTGSILHIHRGFVFAQNRTLPENSGLWVARATSVISTASKGRENTSSATDLTKLNPALRQQNGMGAMAPPQRVGRDRLIGQHVHIRRGMYKGMRGICKDTTASSARVELQAKNKVVNVDKNDLSVVDQGSGKTVEYQAFNASRGPSFAMRSGPGTPGSRVPTSAGGRTPFNLGDGSQTPAWGASSRTPAWTGAGGLADSGRTPAWRPTSGAQTSYGGAGGMTSYGGAGNYGAGGGRTPAWSSSAKTPYSGDHGYGESGGSGYDAFAAGARTPYGAGAAASSRTPAWGGPNSNAAPTPAARSYDAPTPAISAPTPGGFQDDGSTPYNGAVSAPTPGAGFGSGPIDAPTPGMPAPGYAKGANKEELKYNRLNAPTPAATTGATPYASGYDAPTPAPGGPTYAEDDDDD